MAEDQRRLSLTQGGRHDSVRNWPRSLILGGLLGFREGHWFGMTLPRRVDREDIVGMEFKRFVHAVMLVPCQVLRQGRRLVLRLLAYTSRARLLFRSMEATARLCFT